MTIQSRLTDHPRLYAGQAELDRLKHPPRRALLRTAAEYTAQKADEYLKPATFDHLENVHNHPQKWARQAHIRVITLLVRWIQTGRERFRRAAIEQVAEMDRWKYWAHVAWRQKNERPEVTFDLGCGENSATLAICYDWLFETLSESERRMLLDIARRRALRPFLAHTGRENPIWWMGKADSNWNAVCAGGAGMLAIAMYEDLPEARKALGRAEKSVAPFMRHLSENSGGWGEGIGYWNYGMRFAFMYLLSHERATGRKHPLLRPAAVKATLSFPLDFCPNGQPCSFGDANSWGPFAFHYAAAARLKRPDIVPILDAHLTLDTNLTRGGLSHKFWPNAAELLLFYPRGRKRQVRRSRKVVKLYRGLDWGIIADRLPEPNIYLSVRGGTTKVEHGHHDLMSFHCLVGDEALINNIGIGEYLDTTFGPRRYELFEASSASKNTLLINGVGIAADSSVSSSIIKMPGAEGIRIDATSAMGAATDSPTSGADRLVFPTAWFCGRVFLMLKTRAFLIIDRFELPFPGRVESRLHTYADVATKRSGVVIIGKRQRLRLGYASSVPAALHTAIDAPTTPGQGATMLRLCPDRMHKIVTMATLLSPGAGAAKVKLAEADGRIIIDAAGKGWSSRVKISKRLRGL